MHRHRAHWMACMAVPTVGWLAGCGGGDSPSLEWTRERPAAVVSAAGSPGPVDGAEVMDWAERTYPQWFGAQAVAGTAPPLLFRHSPGTGTYIGIDNTRLYVMGGPFGNVPLPVGTVDDFACAVRLAQCEGPQIISQPADAELSPGEAVQLAVQVAGGPSLNYLWFRNGVEIKGAREAQLRVLMTEQDVEAEYSVVISNDKGSVRSRMARVVRVPMPDIAAAVAIAQREGCSACHAVNTAMQGPAYTDVAARYRGTAGAGGALAASIIQGSSGRWGGSMAPQSGVTPQEAQTLAVAILALAEGR